MYLVNALGKPVTSAGSAGITVEDRVYKVDENGKISYVKKNPIAADTVLTNFREQDHRCSL